MGEKSGMGTGKGVESSGSCESEEGVKTRTRTGVEKAKGKRSPPFRHQTVFKRRRMSTRKARDAEDARKEGNGAMKKVGGRGRKAVRGSRTGTGKKGAVLGPRVEVEMEVQLHTERWTVQALGYRRERGRKRAGTGGRA